mmetsp:Transcript_99984/g.214186  ORF Transcript_99984/g.214186 Transcript_99984/m.214186 type:complete len:314 (+) Transcript_99984:97-1038(+)
MSFIWSSSNANKADVQPLIAEDSYKIMDSVAAMQALPNVSVSGGDSQMCVVTLAPNEEIVVQPGCMMWCDEGIVTDISTGAFSGLLTRMCCAGENVFRVHWQNRSSKPQKIGLTNVHQTRTQIGDLVTGPGKIVPMNLDEHGGQLNVSSGLFMAAMDKDVDFSAVRTKSLGKAAFGGQGLFILKLTGRGIVLLNGYGTVMERDLGENETVVIDQMSLVAWASTVTFGYRMAGGAGMLCCGGEGLTNTTLKGPGRIVLQSVSSEAKDQANPLGLIICLIHCMCFLLLLLGGVAGAGVESEAIAHNATVLPTILP